jgi:endonuclease/exonuclease/phosphatase family metal-dependent hydrolase
MKKLKSFLLWCNILLVLATIGSYVSPSIDPNTASYFSLLGLSYPILLILNLLFVIIWLIVDLKYALISIIILGIGYVHLNEFVGFNSPKKPSQKTLSIVSYNIGNASGAYSRKKSAKKKKQEKLAKFLERFDDEDILCFQEVGVYANEQLSKNLPHKYIHKLKKGAVIVSKHPIINSGLIEFGTITNSCLWADIKVGLDTIRTYSIHLQSNAITNDANEVLDSPDLNDEKTWLGIRGIMSKYVSSHIKRSNQAKLVKEHIDTSPYPTIVCGDFNDTPLTYTYSVISEGLKDNFIEAGNGLGTTFNGRIPLLRIDYILTSPSIEVYNFNIIKERFSDHYPIASVVALKD